MKKSSLKTLKFIFASLLFILIICFTVLSFVDSPIYALRTMTLFSSDINDYKVFASRLVESPAVASRLLSEPQSMPDEITYPYQGGTKTETLYHLLNRTDTNAFIVIKEDRVIYEEYPGFTREGINTSFSSAKSFDSALIGAAIADGYISSVDDAVIKYIPELAGRGLDDLTIRNLLRMDTGIRYRSAEQVLSPFSDDALTYYPPDLRKIALSVQPSEMPIGAEFHYNNFHPLLEGIILERATGMPVAEYLERRIWQPMGTEFDASWSIDSRKSGFEKMESGINARAIDYARFGLLYLHHGYYNGHQILPEAWVDASTQPDPADQRAFQDYPEWKENGGYYGFHWWGKVYADGSHDFMALGHLGQVIYVSPEHNMVVVRFGSEPDDSVNWPDVIKALIDEI